MAVLQIYQKLLSPFLWVHPDSKEVSYLSLENTYPKLKAACHINSELNSELNLRELTPCKISYTCHCDLKIKTSMTFVYKEYEVKIKMIQ